MSSPHLTHPLCTEKFASVIDNPQSSSRDKGSFPADLKAFRVFRSISVALLNNVGAADDIVTILKGGECVCIGVSNGVWRDQPRGHREGAAGPEGCL